MAYNEINNIDSPNFTSGRGGKKVDRIVIHWWDDPARNPSAEGVVATLTNPSRQASAHYVITGTGRRAWCLVAESDTAWHAGDFDINQRSIGLECDPRCRNEDYDVVAEVIADLWRYYGKIPLTPHRQYSSTACPGNYDLARLQREAEAKLAPPKPSKPSWVAMTTPRMLRTNKKVSVTNLITGKAEGTALAKGTDVAFSTKADWNGELWLRSVYATGKGFDWGIRLSDLDEIVVEPPKPPVEPKPPVVEPPVVTPPATDWGEKNNVLLNKLVEMVQWIIDKLKGVFK
mgnify:CR=1 FL=1